MITGNPLSPELKHAIDTIKNNPNTSPEQKQEEFGLLMAGMKEKLGYLSENSSDSNMLDAGGLGGMPDSVQMPPTGQDQSSGLGGMLRNVPFVGSGIRAAENLTGMIPKDVAANPFIKQILPNGMVQKDNDGNFQLTMEKKMPPPPPTPSIPQAMQGQMQQTPMQNIQPRPVPPQSAQIEGLLKHPSRWDMIKEKMFAGEDQQGLFGKAGANRGSMGLGGYFNDLFNDPARMAMLSGGLTAMDQNSYYDKEGFQSPWTGLRSGLGGAQAGYKSVIDRRKAEADTALAKAKTRSEMVTGREDKVSVSATNTDVIALNKTLANKLKLQYMKPVSLGGLGLSETEAYHKAIGEVTARAADKGMRAGDSAKLFAEYETSNVTLDKIKEAKKLVRPGTTSFLATIKRGVDVGLTFAQITHNPSDATKLTSLMDQLAYPMMQSVIGIPLTSKLIDSEAERTLIKNLQDNPKIYGSPVMLLKKLNVIESLYKKLQKDRKKRLGGRADNSPSVGSAQTSSGVFNAKDFISSLTPDQ